MCVCVGVCVCVGERGGRGIVEDMCYEESVGLINQATISQRSPADVRADLGQVHPATRGKHPHHARKALLVLDDRGIFAPWS